jgi:2-hydroxychromene-2-carboxylate isomerase
VKAKLAARAFEHEGGIFYFDFASPLCYLAAELISAFAPGIRDWRAIPARRLPVGEGSWQRAQIEREADALGLLALRWPPPHRGELRFALLAATYARGLGRGIAFARAAFRQAFAGGQDLSDPDRLLIAGAACELHPAALLRAGSSRRIDALLESITAEAIGARVSELPAVAVADRLHCGWQEVRALCANLDSDGKAERVQVPGGTL